MNEYNILRCWVDDNSTKWGVSVTVLRTSVTSSPLLELMLNSYPCCVMTSNPFAGGEIRLLTNCMNCICRFYSNRVSALTKLPGYVCESIQSPHRLCVVVQRWVVLLSAETFQHAFKNTQTQTNRITLILQGGEIYLNIFLRSYPILANSIALLKLKIMLGTLSPVSLLLSASENVLPSYNEFFVIFSSLMLGTMMAVWRMHQLHNTHIKADVNASWHKERSK